MDPAGEATRRYFDPTRVREFELVLREFAANSGSEFVNLMEPFQAHLDDGQSLLVDGVHPNNEGHELIYRAVKPALAQWLPSLG
jgi:lysophospholipase L1-like esterase